MFTKALFLRAKRCKPHKCQLVHEWINKVWYIHTTEYQSVNKKNEIQTYSTSMNLKNIMVGACIVAY